jgi:hypothetical protein
MSAGWYSGPITPSVNGAVFAFVSAPRGPLVAVARTDSEQAASGAESVPIASLGLGSGWGIAVGELGDATTALGVVPICIGFGLRCRIERGAFSDLATAVDSALIAAGGDAVIVVPGGGERLDFIAAGWRSCSRRCHKQTKCVAANSVLFNHFVGNRKERRRNV